MWMQPECPPCLLNRILFEADLVDSGDRTRIMEESLAMLSNGFHQFNSARLATRIHARAYELIGVDDQVNARDESLAPYAHDVIAEEFSVLAEAETMPTLEQLRTAIRKGLADINRTLSAPVGE